MPSKNYIKGSNLERDLVNQYREKGYYACRVAGSKSPFDVIVLTNNKLLLIQCKAGKLSDSALNEAIEKMPEVPIEVVVRRQIFNKNGRKERLIEVD